MTALVSIFSFLKVFLVYFTTIIFGGTFFKNDFKGGFEQEIAGNIITQVSNGLMDNYINFPGVPICQLFIGIIVLGSIIRLAKRLING